MDLVFKTLAVSIGFVMLLWLPVLWGYLVAKRKGLAKPRLFAFLSGCLGYGFHTLVSALVAIPLETYLLKVAPLHCLESQNKQLCSVYEFIDQWEVLVGLAALIVVALLCPFVFNRYVWSRFGNH